MTETSPEEPRPCIVCNIPTTARLAPSKNAFVIVRDDGTGEAEWVTRVPVCDDHFRDVFDGRYQAGWCTDCKAWGLAGAVSACGNRYKRYG